MENDFIIAFRALWGAAMIITEEEEIGNGECRYCHVEEYPADNDGNRTEGEAVQYCMDHEEWCPSYIIDHAFSGIDSAIIGRVMKGVS